MAEKPKKILVVDAGSATVARLSQLLRKMGVGKTVIAESGLEALRIVKMWIPDLILLDAGLPDMDGITFIRRVKDRGGELSDVPVIVLSGGDTAKGSTERLAPEATGHLFKPFDVSQLHDLIQECVMQAGGKKRYHLRAVYREAVSVRHKGKTHTLRATTLSEGGVYLRTDSPFPVGSSLELEVPLEKKRIRVKGTVLYHGSPGTKSRLTPAGMSVEFTGLSKRAQKVLGTHVLGLITGQR
jgi:CheY-like chemotaxis protein